MLEALLRARVYDLAHSYYLGMPHVPTHPPFLFSLTRLLGEQVRPEGVSSASDALAFSGHAGTHMDALCHFSRQGRLHGGVEVEGLQTAAEGIGALSIETVAPVLRRGVLVDVAARQGVETLPPDFLIGPEHLEETPVRPGDVVLLRTGWGSLWKDGKAYVNQGHGPGPGIQAARWLSQRGIFAAGSDTLSFERVPDPGMPVHAHLLVDHGIHIFENLWLEDLARDQVLEFAFVALPLKIRGGTASPVRPVAIS